jgi:transcriptional regulator with XRE-family HTH domain
LEEAMTNEEMMQKLGERLRAEREMAGLSQSRVGVALGMKSPGCHSYLRRIEQGKLSQVGFATVVRYLQACKVPIGKFMLELAQSGAFGEVEQGLTIAEDRTKADEAKRTRAQQRNQRRGEREAEDAAIIVKLWNEVQAAIYPLLPKDPTIFLSHYLEGVRAFYRAWKLATRGALNHDPTLDVQMAFDRIEQAGLQRLVPAAVHKMREVVFERLMAMTLPSGNT